MRVIKSEDIMKAVKELCFPAAYDLPKDVSNALKKGVETEESPLGKSILQQVVENSEIARNENRPICQDTGFAVIFCEIGQECLVEGVTIEEAIQQGIREGYEAGYLRKSIVNDPLFDRVNTTDNTPAVIHLSTVPGDKISLLLAPKGGGSENMSKLNMMKPSDGEEGVFNFVVDSVVNSGGNPCPPTIVGVGIGGTFEKCAEMAKRALLRNVGEPHPDERYAKLEKRILDAINRSGVGPQGLGGTVTALAVHIETHPCHIAQMPVAVNLNCHAARHAEVVI